MCIQPWPGPHFLVFWNALPSTKWKKKMTVANQNDNDNKNKQNPATRNSERNIGMSPYGNEPMMELLRLLVLRIVAYLGLGFCGRGGRHHAQAHCTLEWRPAATLRHWNAGPDPGLLWRRLQNERQLRRNQHPSLHHRHWRRAAIGATASAAGTPADLFFLILINITFINRLSKFVLRYLIGLYKFFFQKSFNILYNRHSCIYKLILYKPNRTVAKDYIA